MRCADAEITAVTVQTEIDSLRSGYRQLSQCRRTLPLYTGLIAVGIGPVAIEPAIVGSVATALLY